MTKQADMENIQAEIEQDSSVKRDPTLDLPKRYLLVVDEKLANESCPVPTPYEPHKIGRTKIHPFYNKADPAPDGFIIMPSAQPIECIQEKHPAIYEILKAQDVKFFPFNG